ncbi:adhesion G protein-coupled receptor A3 [Nematostella vectensis]|uniref:adhesion G protein-coupled receptor A3 n=1 Tax=Nematostella vectensis TaxID=45351 RepID=UPI0020775C58|nr:adhesion G protein-coupled receptor A3 [Nematostella vectensis]
MYSFVGVALVCCLLFGSVLHARGSCPVGCVCVTSKGGSKITADCRNRGFKEIMNSDSLVNVTKLDLSNNDITAINNKAFAGRKTLKELYLSRNKIANIDPGAFNGLEALNKLDLSNNELTVLSGQVFKGLRSLKNLILQGNKLNFINATVFPALRRLRRLNLSNNKFISIPDGTFKALNALKQLDLGSNDLLCDCQMQWLLKYKQRRKLSLKGKCQYPKSLQYTKVSSLKPKQLQTCGKLELPFEFKPKNGLVGIYGDSISLTCMTTWIPGLKINWYKNTGLLIPGTEGVPWKITFDTDFDENRVTSKLSIAKLNNTDSGLYQCNVSTKVNFILGEARIKALAGNSRFCPAEVTKTSKGHFYWDNTDVGVVARLECPAGHARESLRSDAMATRECSYGGWLAVKASNCAYDDRITQSLYELKQFGVNRTTVLGVSSGLLNITSFAARFTTPQDVIYTAQILKGLVAHANSNELIAKTVVRIVSNTMNAKRELLAAAQWKDRSCSSMILTVEAINNFDASSLLQLTTTNIGVASVHVFPAAFQGKTCATFFDEKSNVKSTLCSLPWRNVTVGTSRPLEASVHLPPYMFGKRSTTPIDRRKLTFTVYRNSNLFPIMRNGTLVDDRRRVVSSVVCLRIATDGLPAQFELRYANITSPMAVKFRKHEAIHEQAFIAYWDISAQGGHGLWLNHTDCRLQIQDKFTIARCTKMRENICFAVVEAIDRAEASSSRKGMDDFVLEPIVFIGAAVCVFLLLMTLFTYIVFKQLRYNRDDAAMLMNECLALLVVVVIFVVGINRDTNPLMCRAIGVLLHYFLLCCLFWVGCGGLCLCRLVRTTLQPEEFNPVLRYYMISWGIPLIICGITVAGNPDNYSVHNYCWLKPNPFLGAFVGPACLIILIDIFMFIRLHFIVKSAYSLQQLQQQEEGVENVEPDAATAEDRENLTEAVVSNSELLEHVHLLPDKNEIQAYQKGSLIVLLLIVINFTLGFLIVRFREPDYLNLGLSCVFAITIIFLGLIIFLFHCYKNPKARMFWAQCCQKNACWRKNKKYTVEQEGNEDEAVDKSDTAKLMNGTAGKPHNGDVVVPKIHGAPSLTQGSDIHSNVSLPSSAALTIDRPGFLVVKSEEQTADSHCKENATADCHSLTAGSDKHSVTAGSITAASVVSDKQSCASAPLPLSHAYPRLREHPPGFRYSYHVPDPIEFKSVKPPKRRGRQRKAPIAMPERNGITSSLESSLRNKALENNKRDRTPPKVQNIEHHIYAEIPESTHSEFAPSEVATSEFAPSELAPSELAPSELAPSELSSTRDNRFLEPPLVPSCASSDVSVPDFSNETIKNRSPLHGASNENAVKQLPPHMRGKVPIERFPLAMFGPGGGNPGYPFRPRYMNMNMPYSRVSEANTRGVEYPRYTSTPSHPRIPGQQGVQRYPGPYNKVVRPIDGIVSEQTVVETQQKMDSDEPSNPPNGHVNGLQPRTEPNTAPNAGFSNRLPGTTNEQLPRRRPRDRSSSDRPRSSRRNREGGSQGRTKDPPEGGIRGKPSSRFGSRTSQSSWRDERPKPEPKPWVPEPVSRVNYVPIPHFISELTQGHDRVETSV